MPPTRSCGSVWNKAFSCNDRSAMTACTARPSFRVFGSTRTHLSTAIGSACEPCSIWAREPNTSSSSRA